MKIKEIIRGYALNLYYFFFESEEEKKCRLKQKCQKAFDQFMG